MKRGMNVIPLEATQFLCYTVNCHQ